MYFFVNDYNDICYPEILDNLKNALDEKNIGYGFDSHSENARDLIRKELGSENCDIYFIPGGTPANILGVAAGMLQQDSVISATTGHIEGHEAGSIEATGLKIETINTADGKLTRKLLEDKLNKFGAEFMTSPKKVYISNTTEVGTVYTKTELMDIYDFCKENNLYLFIDGARIAAALVSDICDYTIKDLTNMCDIFYLGGTKNGFMLGEALVIVNETLKKNFINLQKQKGAMLAKGFIPGIMFETVFNMKDGYLKGARVAFEKAKKLSKELEKKGIELAHPFQSNQIFVKIDEGTKNKREEFASFEIMGEEDEKYIARLVTTYRTTDDDIDGFIDKIN